VSTESPAAGTQNVAAQGGIVAGMTLLSRISGFVRDMVLSHFFGATADADAFFVAFRIPNFFRRLFAEGAFNQAFVPVLAGYVNRVQGADEQARRTASAGLERFVAVMLGNLGLALALIVLLGMVCAPLLIGLFAPGFIGDDARFDAATGMVRITFPYLGLISLTALAGAVLNSHHRYAIPAFTPVLLNLCLISAMLFAADLFDEPVFALAWGVLLAGFVQLAFQAPPLQRLGLLVRPRVDYRHEGAREVGTLLLPAVFAASVNQINALIDTMLASTLITGSISWLYYADRLMELPLGLVAVALGTVLLPNLSRLHAADDPGGYSATLDWGLRLGLILGLPAAVALYVLAVPLVASIFFHGAMEPLDVRMAALGLQAFALALPALVLVKVLAPAYFAARDTATPFRFGVVAVLVNVALNFALFSWMGHLGLALATAASAWVNAMLLLRGLLREDRYRPGVSVLRALFRVLPATLAMAGALWWLSPDTGRWLDAALVQRVQWITTAVLGGGALYLLVLLAVGERPADLKHRA